MATLITTIDQHRGDHPTTGMRIMALTTIRTDPADHEGASESTVLRYHLAQLALNELDAAARAAALLAIDREEQERGSGLDLDDHAAIIERAVAGSAPR